MVTRGGYAPGDRLPTEIELARRYDVSRPTVTRALKALESERLIVRRAGSGSYVEGPPATGVEGRLFGLVIPGLGRGEIFEPICAEIAKRAEEHRCSLLWSGSEIETERAAHALVQVARRYIEHRVAGVFFEPLELSPSFDTINRRLVSMFAEAGIPIVLIDSDYLPFPKRSDLDLVGIDNFRSGYLVADHFLRRGLTRLDFLARPYSAYTISVRLRGYRGALIDYGVIPRDEWVHFGDPADEAYVAERIIGGGASHLVCANDETAATLMTTLDNLGVPVPERLKVIGFDDVRYAKLLRVPLSTLHQPVEEIADLAMETMLWRIVHPNRPPRTCLAPGTVITRQSCGA